MSKEDGTMYQHIVPKAHLERFTGSDGMLWVHRFKDGIIGRPYQKSPSKVCGELNYYDDNPWIEHSMEKGLKILEDKGQRAIDQLLDHTAGFPERRNVISYIGMLVGRSKEMSQAHDYSSWQHGTFEEPIEIDDIGMRQTSIVNSFDNLFLHDYDEYRCIELWGMNGPPFITGDVPYAITTFDNATVSRRLRELGPELTPENFHFGDPKKIEQNNMTINKLADITREYIVICPLTLSLCVIVYHDSIKDINGKVAEMLGENPPWTVNRLIMQASIDEVYTNAPMEYYIGTLAFSMSHDREVMFRDLEEMRDYAIDNRIGSTEGEGKMKSSKEQKHPMNQIDRMIASLRFPPIPNPEYDFIAFYRSLRENYPIYRTTLIPSGSPDIPPTQQHDFISEDGSWFVSVSNRHLSLLTNKCDSVEEFLSRFGSVRTAFDDVLGAQHYAFIGFRTMYAMRPSTIEGIGDCQSTLSKPYSDLFRSSIGKQKNAAYNTFFDLPGILKGKVTISPIKFKDKEHGMHLDIDVFTEDKVDSEAVSEIMRELIGNSREIFLDVTDEKVHCVLDKRVE